MATTINPVNVRIGYDGSKLKAGVDMSRADLGRLGTIVRGSVSSTERFRHEMDLLNVAMQKGAIDAYRYAEAVKYLKQIHGQTLGSKLEQIPGGKFAAGFIGVSAGIGAFSQMMKLTTEVEKASVAFEVLIGDANKAMKMIADMKALDARSPLNFVDIQQAGKILLGYGVAHEKVMPMMERLGDISMGDANKLQSLALAFGQVTAAGRLMGQEVLQLVNAGFNPLQQISYDTGRSMADLKKAMENGEISVAMVEQAFISATSAGGRFDGMADRMSNTAAGAFAKMQSSIQQAAVTIGTELIPAMQSAAEVATQLASSPLTKLLAGGVNSFSTGWSSIIDAVGSLGREGDDPFAWLDERARKAAAQAAQRKISEREFDIKEAARKKQDELNAIAEIKAQKEAAEKAIRDKDQAERAKAAQKRLDAQRKDIDEQWKRGRQMIKEKEEAERRLRQDVEQAARRFDPMTRLVADFKELERLRAGGLDPLLVDREQGDLARRAAEEELSDRKYGAVSAQAGSRAQWDILVEKQKGQSKEAEIARIARQKMVDALEKIEQKPAGVILSDARDLN